MAPGFGCPDRAGVAQGEMRSLHIAHLPALGHPTQGRKALVVPFPVGRSLLLPASRQPAGMWWDILGKIVQGIVEMLCFDDDDDYYFSPH